MNRLKLAAPLLVIFLLSVFVWGCGGDNGRAKQLMTAADQSYQVLHEQGIRLQRLEEAAGTALFTTDPAKLIAVSSQIPEIKAGMDSYQVLAKATLAKYEKILPLSGVPDYKTYANMMISSVKLLIDSVVVGEQVIAAENALIAKLKAGEQVNLTAAQAPLFTQINKALDLAKKGKDQGVKAAAYQKANKL